MSVDVCNHKQHHCSHHSPSDTPTVDVVLDLIVVMHLFDEVFNEEDINASLGVSSFIHLLPNVVESGADEIRRKFWIGDFAEARRRNGEEDRTASRARIVVLEPVLNARLAKNVLAVRCIDADDRVFLIEGLEADAARVGLDHAALQKLLAGGKCGGHGRWVRVEESGAAWEREEGKR